MNRLNLFEEFSRPVDETTWLIDVESKLREVGYRKYNQKYKKEDYAYWKVFKDDEGKDLYQIGLLFYDHKKYDPNGCMSIQFECLVLNTTAAMRFILSDNISLEQFESLSSVFYNTVTKEFYSGKNVCTV